MKDWTQGRRQGWGISDTSCVNGLLSEMYISLSILLGEKEV